MLTVQNTNVLCLLLQTFPSFPLAFKEYLVNTQKHVHNSVFMACLSSYFLGFLPCLLLNFSPKIKKTSTHISFQKMFFHFLHFIFKCQIHMGFMLITMRIRHIALLPSKQSWLSLILTFSGRPQECAQQHYSASVLVYVEHRGWKECIGLPSPSDCPLCLMVMDLCWLKLLELHFREYFISFNSKRTFLSFWCGLWVEK